jgi:xanthine/CO dehydrogenase XdhC/CoxF family maturation factor
MERSILDAIDAAAAAGEQAVVATVVNTFGSAPRQPRANPARSPSPRAAAT